MKKPLLLMVLACMFALPMIGLVGCGGSPSSEPTGVQSSGEDPEAESDEYVAGEEAMGQE